MKHVDTLIVGGGQAGLALSRCLTDRSVTHVVLERGQIGERWRSERWDSLRLLTPRWQSRLPGHAYRGPDPDGYMSRQEVIEYLEGYAASFPAPVETGVTVESAQRIGQEYIVQTDRGTWTANRLVVATGDCHESFVPDLATNLSADVHQVVPTAYRNPTQLPEGGVLVVGASATGLQLASEIHATGRPVTLSVSRHTRLPRTYRGRDILAWLDEMGLFGERAEEVRDLTASRAQPSLQLIGSDDRRTLDLQVAMEEGIRLTGRTIGADGHTVRFDDNLVEDVAAADLKLARLRMRIDQHIAAAGLSGLVPPPSPLSMTDVGSGPSSLDLSQQGIRSVLWATGFKRSYPWLSASVFDERGEIVHEGGVTPEPGLYVMGLRFLRRRNSSFIDGQALDAEEIADHILAHQQARSTAAA